VFGVPVRAPVVVLKFIPDGVALMLKLAIAPPVELVVKPVAAVFTVRVSDDEDKVNAGAAKRDVITRLLVPLELTATNKPFPYVTDSQVLFAAAVRAVQVAPLFVLVITAPLAPTATNAPSPYVTEFQLEVVPVVREVQLIPSGLVIAAPLSPTATKVLSPYVTSFQLDAGAAGFGEVQLLPLVLVITRFVPLELTATNNPLPYVTDSQVLVLFSAAVRAVKRSPLFSMVITAPLAPTATYKPSPYVTERQSELIPFLIFHVVPFVLVFTLPPPVFLTATNKLFP
jgi:hypothetical protein